mmetsp:Transcript_43074/g.125309  ORF Transcript_43074/g.125309 Transcript_43074/m.125309 type:complete len:290 (+) Transcript_43074:617-1486(+)
MSRRCDSGETSFGKPSDLEMFSSSIWMESCFSFNFFSSSALLSAKPSMNCVISLSLVKRISYFCCSLFSSLPFLSSCASVVTSRMCERNFSFSSFSSEIRFSAATISPLSLFTFCMRSSRWSWMLKLHCCTSVSRAPKRSWSSRRTLPSCWYRVRSGSLRRQPSMALSRPLTWSSSSRDSCSCELSLPLSTRSSSYSWRCVGCSSFNLSSAARAMFCISCSMRPISSSWLRFSRKIWSTSCRCSSFCCFMWMYMWWTSSGRVSVRCLSVARLWSARSPSRDLTVFTRVS